MFITSHNSFCLHMLTVLVPVTALSNCHYIHISTPNCKNYGTWVPVFSTDQLSSLHLKLYMFASSIVAEHICLLLTELLFLAGNGQVRTSDDSDEQIYWLRPKSPSPKTSPETSDHLNWLNRKLSGKHKVTFDDSTSTR